MISIIKASKPDRIKMLKDFILIIIVCLAGITLLINMVIQMIDDGWIIYSNPL